MTQKRKKFDDLWDADKAIRRACPVGMEEGVKLTITYKAGFEVCCYESWGASYTVTGPVGPIGHDWPEPVMVSAGACDLDVAIERWVAARDKKKAELAQPTPTKDGEGL